MDLQKKVLYIIYLKDCSVCSLTIVATVKQESHKIMRTVNISALDVTLYVVTLAQMIMALMYVATVQNGLRRDSRLLKKCLKRIF